MTQPLTAPSNSTALIQELRQLVLDTRQQAVQQTNSLLTLMYWEIGYKINTETLNNQRADYNKQIVATVSRQLKDEFGRGFEEKNLRRMIKFATAFNKKEVEQLIYKFSWSHFVETLPMKDELKRTFYIQMCIQEKWSVRTFRERINSMLYERTALAKQPAEAIRQELQALEQGKANQQIFLKDPYLLDFLELNDHYFEKDLEDAILRQLEGFLLELGNGFSFIARQKRIQLDYDDYYIDLLFYNRTLKRLIAIDLKIGDFKPEYKGQMELYLKWLDKYERQDGEDSPIGIILCAGKKEEQIELLELEQSGIHVAEYLTVLPPKDVLQNKLHQALLYAQEKYST